MKISEVTLVGTRGSRPLDPRASCAPALSNETCEVYSMQDSDVTIVMSLLFMAALLSRCAHYILPFGFFFFLFLFPRLISAVADWMSISYFHTWCGLSANLECRPEMCCTRLAGNIGRKNHHLGTIPQLAESSRLRHVSTIGKNLLNSNISSTCPHNMAKFVPLAAEICWRVWDTPANFNRFRVLFTFFV